MPADPNETLSHGLGHLVGSAGFGLLRAVGPAGASGATSHRRPGRLRQHRLERQRVVRRGAGDLYVFLSDGSLVITSSNSKPALGKWRYEGGVLTMIETGLPYQADIVTLTRDEFTIKSHDAGAGHDYIRSSRAAFPLKQQLPMKPALPSSRVAAIGRAC